MSWVLTQVDLHGWIGSLFAHIIVHIFLNFGLYNLQRGVRTTNKGPKMLYWVGKFAKTEGEWTLYGHYAKCMSFAYILHSKHVISKKHMNLNTFILHKTKEKQIKIHSEAHIIVIEWYARWGFSLGGGGGLVNIITLKYTKLVWMRM